MIATIKTTVTAPTTDGAALAAAYAHNSRDTGGAGRAAEVLVRQYLTGEVHRVHPLGTTDVVYQRRSIEVKTRAGWLVNPYTGSKEQVLFDWREKSRIMKGAQYIAYSPWQVPAGVSMDDMTRFFRVYRISVFRRCITPFTQIRGKAGLYGLAICQFYQSKKKEQALLDALDDTPSWSLDEFKALF